MLLMKDRVVPTYFRTTHSVATKVSKIIGSLGGVGRFLARGKSPTREALISGAILWMESMEPEKLESTLGPYIELFESRFKAANAEVEPESAPESRTSEFANPPHKQKRGKG